MDKSGLEGELGVLVPVEEWSSEGQPTQRPLVSLHQLLNESEKPEARDVSYLGISSGGPTW